LEKLSGFAEGTQRPDQLGQVDPEDHQGQADGRGGQAAQGAGGGQAARPYASRLAEVMGSLAAKVAGQDNGPLLMRGTGSDQRHLLVVVNTDKGLCGGLNSSSRKPRPRPAR
jgi:hypothetical protein